jgi:hypothetical protein
MAESDARARKFCMKEGRTSSQYRASHAQPGFCYFLQYSTSRVIKKRPLQGALLLDALKFKQNELTG